MTLGFLPNWSFYGNTAHAWAVAAAALVAVFGVLLIARRVLISRLGRLAARTPGEFDDFVVRLIRRTRAWFLLLGAAYGASYALTLTDEARDHLRSLFGAGLIVQSAFWGNDVIGYLLGRYEQRQTGGKSTVTAISFLSRLALWTVLALLLLDNFGVHVGTLIATLGVGGIAVALAAQSVLGDLLAAISIYLDKPFVIGDFIIFDDILGTVKYVGLRSTRIQSLSGELIVMSNSDLLKARIRNYQQMAERRAVFTIGVAYGLSYEALASVQGILREAVTSQGRARLDRAHFKEYAESAMRFEVVYYVLSPDYGVYMDLQQAINLFIFRRFEEAGIAFAHPIRVISSAKAAPSALPPSLEPHARAAKG